MGTMKRQKRVFHYLVPALGIALAAVLLPANSAVGYRDSDPAGRPKLTRFEMNKDEVINNHYTDIKINFGWDAPGVDLRYGALKLSVTDDNGKNYIVTIDLTKKKFSKETGTAQAKVRLVCSASEWLKIRAWLQSPKGRKTRFKKTSLNSVPNPDDDPTYKTDWPLGTEPNTRAMNFTLYDQNGKKVALWDFYGKMIFVDFGAMWCGPCKWMAEDIKKLWKKWGKNENAVFLSVFHEGYTYGEPVTRNELNIWVNEHKMDYPHLGDPDQVAWKLYRDPEKPNSVPQYMMIDPFMQISFKNVGYGPNFFYDQINDSFKYWNNRWFKDK